jgi:hypothetical protein
MANKAKSKARTTMVEGGIISILMKGKGKDFFHIIPIKHWSNPLHYGEISALPALRDAFFSHSCLFILTFVDYE